MYRAKIRLILSADPINLDYPHVVNPYESSLLSSGAESASELACLSMRQGIGVVACTQAILIGLATTFVAAAMLGLLPDRRVEFAANDAVALGWFAMFATYGISALGRAVCMRACEAPRAR